MRIARVISVLIAVLTAVLVLSPAAAAEEPLRLQTQVTDSAGALSRAEVDQIQGAFYQLYGTEQIRIWVVFVNNFVSDNGQPISGSEWAERTAAVNSFGENDLLLAIAPTLREYGYAVRDSYIDQARLETVLREDVEPAFGAGDWAQGTIALAEGLGPSAASSSGDGGDVSWVTVLVIVAVIALLLAGLLLWSRSRRQKRRAAEFEAAKRVDPTDPAALAAVPIDALDQLSKAIVVDVDNAVRTSETELAFAVDEFGPHRTRPFVEAVSSAKAALTQAFTIRQTLDDSVPETPEQRRELLTRAVVAAARADRDLDKQTGAFEELRNLVINAPTRLDTLTQQMVDVTARLEPSAQTLAQLHQQYAAPALAAVVDNVETARERVAFADKNITVARGLLTKPATDQTALVDAVHAAESALAQGRTLLDAVDSASSDINRAIASLPEAITDAQQGIDDAARLGQKTTQAAALEKARAAVVEAVADAQRDGATDPLGTFTQLTKADADLDRLRASVAEEQQNAERLARQLEQALFTAGSRVKAVSDFIETRRGSIGSEARTRLAEATRQLEAANAKRESNPNEAIAHANGASTLAAQAQQLANDDVVASQRQYTSNYGRGGSSDMGAMIGGILVGSILNSGRGNYGSWNPGRSAGRPGSYGGTSRSSGRSYNGGGRF